MRNLSPRARHAIRVVRTCLVLGVNTWFLYHMVATKLHTHAAQRADPARAFHADPIFASDIAWAVPLAVGIVAELTSFTPAWVINVGYYGIAALYLFVGFLLALGHVFGFAEPEHWVLAVMFRAVPWALFALLLNAMYWLTRTPEENAA